MIFLELTGAEIKREMETWVVEEPKWHWTLQQYLSRFQDQGILCDTVLACANGKTIKAHSCVLAAASERIRNLLDGVQTNDYTLRMHSVTSTTWHYILRFIYDGRVALPSDQVGRVKDAAIRFQIVPLINLLNTLEKHRGQIATAESNIGRKTSTSFQDEGDVIVLDDEDDDNNDGDLVVESETNVVHSVTVPTTEGTANVSGSDSDSVEPGSSSSRSSRLPKSSDDSTASTLVPRLATTSLLDDSCANVPLENPLLSASEAHKSGASDMVSSNIRRQSTDINSVGSQVLSKSYGSSQFSSVVPNTSLYTVLRDDRLSSSDTNETFDVSEVVCMDSPASGDAQAEDKATEDSCLLSEDILEEKSSVIARNSCRSTAPPKTPSLIQAASFACSPVSNIYSQFIVSKPSGITLRVDVKATERTDMSVERALETVANDSLPAREHGVSEDQYGPVDARQNAPEISPWEDRLEDESPLLCISNVVSLSGQVTDFSEPDSAFITRNNDLCNMPSTAEGDVTTDDLRTRVLCFEDGSNAATPFISLSPPTTMENPIVNSTESVKETTQTTQVSNCAEVIPQTEVPLPKAALRINVSSSAILSGVPGLFNGPNLMQPSSASNLSGSNPALRFLVVRSANTAKTVSTSLSTQSSRNSQTFPLRNSSFSNIRLVSLARDSQCSAAPQSIVSSLSGSYKQFQIPSRLPVPAVPLSGFVEEFPVPSAVPFPAVPLPGHVEEVPVPPAVPFGAISHVSRPVLEFSDPDQVEETYPNPTGSIIPYESDQAQKTPSFVPPLKNPYTFSAESTTAQRPQLFKKSGGLKRGPKRRKAMPPVETAKTPTKTSGSATEYTWPGESRQFNGCAKLTTHHDFQRKSRTGKSSVVAKVTRLRKTKKLTELTSVVGPNGKPDSQVAGSSFADETSFVQPDSTVLETRPLPLGGDIYNFTESDSESNVLSGRPKPSVTSTWSTGTLYGSAKVAKKSEETVS